MTDTKPAAAGANRVRDLPATMTDPKTEAMAVHSIATMTATIEVSSSVPVTRWLVGSAMKKPSAAAARTLAASAKTTAGRRRPSTFTGDDDYARYGRSPRFREEGYRRPYTGRFQGRGLAGGDDGRFDRGDRWTPERQRDFTGTASGIHDPHYNEWRRRQLDELDRDYDDYRRENQSRFEDDFSSWRSTRQGKRQLLGQVREHMTVVGSDEEHIGTVDNVRGDRIVLTKSDSEDGHHHSLQCWMVDRVEGDRVILDRPAAEAKQLFSAENLDRGLFDRDDDRGTGPHMLNRSFSGTYER